MPYTDKEYLDFNMGSGDDFPVEVEFRRTKLVVTRKEHPCVGYWSDGLSHSHTIPVGSRVYRETGKCEGTVGTCYICLSCLDSILDRLVW